MEPFKSNDKLFDLVNKNHNLLPVFNRFGIRPGFKDKTVTDACAEKNINKEFFLAVVNTYHNPVHFPEEELLSFSPKLIVDYLQRTHEYYIDYFLPKIEAHLNKFIENNSSKDLKMIITFYDKYKKEFLLHIKDEEENVFPYVLKLLNKRDEGDDLMFTISFEKEHTNVEVKLSDLKNLLLKYLEPAYDDNDFNEFLSSLFQFEKDIIDHARIEDKILVPQIEKIKKTK
ncbi:MAG: hemerythrin domain-containing protein [Bacteroidales bacterium]|nr:hemerythrin domain-containing protein [Bacteroidales bacterium]MCF8403145.1 hemerythrin domain-containing protein [Bacteroidales bacterium]